MTLRYIPFVLFAGLLISGALHAMETQNPNVITMRCNIRKNTENLSLITFSGAFVKYLQGTRNIHNTVTLQCSVTESPTVTINPPAQLITIQCAFKDIATQQCINVREDIPLGSQTVTRTLSNDWQMTITTILPTGNNPDR